MRALNRSLILLILVIHPNLGWAFQQTSDRSILEDFVRLFTESRSKGPRLPVDPRTMINLEDKVSTPTKVTIGIQTDILGLVQTDLKTEVEYIRDYSVSTLIIVEGENADIVKRTASGSYFLDAGNRKAVRLCAISASLNLTTTYSGKIFSPLAGGLQRGKVHSGTEEIRQTSELVEVNPGESPDFHKKACADFAERKYGQVMKSLKGLAASRIYWDELSQCNPKEPINGTSVCDKWHQTVLPVVAAWTVPVCEKRTGQRNYFCAIRSKKGGACTYRDPETKKRLTRGMFEYPCAKGLECKVVKPSGWFNYAEAECKVKPQDNSNSNLLTPASISTTH